MSKSTEASTAGHLRQISLLAATLALLPYGFASENPCLEKRWVESPVIARSSGHGGDGMGGTGRSKDEDGIGGTGRSTGSEGIGGTGRSPAESGSGSARDFGFIGVIAGFASICVNGQEIHFDPATAIQIDGKAASAAQLSLGQMVSVAAEARRSAYYASRIEIFNTLSGPLQDIDAAHGTLRILGQTLLANDNTTDLTGFVKGDRLVANGSRLPNGDILLTRLERTSSVDEVSLVGPVTELAGDTFKIFGTTIHGSPSAGQTPRLGQEVLVRGRLVGDVSDGVQASSVLINPQLRFAAGLQQLDLQGHIRRIEGSQLNVGGTEIRLNPSAQAAVQSQQALSEGLRVRVSATLDAEGRFVADQIRIERPVGRSDRLPPPDNPERNVARRGNERDSMEGAAPPGRPDFPMRPERPAREAELERPRPELVRPEIIRPPRPDRPLPR